MDKVADATEATSRKSFKTYHDHPPTFPLGTFENSNKWIRKWYKRHCTFADVVGVNWII